MRDASIRPIDRLRPTILPPRMPRLRTGALTLALLLVMRGQALAGDPEGVAALVLETGRPALPSPEPDVYRFFVHGEEQIRVQAQRSFPMIASASARAAQPGTRE